jgi:hypothetical protein
MEHLLWRLRERRGYRDLRLLVEAHAEVLGERPNTKPADPRGRGGSWPQLIGIQTYHRAARNVGRLLHDEDLYEPKHSKFSFVPIAPFF